MNKVQAYISCATLDYVCWTLVKARVSHKTLLWTETSKSYSATTLAPTRTFMPKGAAVVHNHLCFYVNPTNWMYTGLVRMQLRLCCFVYRAGLIYIVDSTRRDHPTSTAGCSRFVPTQGGNRRSGQCWTIMQVDHCVMHRWARDRL